MTATQREELEELIRVYGIFMWAKCKGIEEKREEARKAISDYLTEIQEKEL